MTRSRGRADPFQQAAADGLRAYGCAVAITSNVAARCPHLKGYPDLTVGHWAWTGLMELKRPGEKLTPAEETFHQQWLAAGGNLEVCYSTGECIDVIRRAEAEARQTHHQGSD